jgi:hypothetical protein
LVSYYNIFDLIFFTLLVYFSYKAYKNKMYIKIFEYIKFFVIISISAKLVTLSAAILQKFYIVKADTYTTLLLISFVINFFILFYFYNNIIHFFNRYINSTSIKNFFAKLVSFLEVLIIMTFFLYIIMQLYISKVHLYQSIHKTYSYKYIEKFYTKFLGDDFLNMLLNTDTNTNYKEVIFKSIKNSL